MSGQYSNKSNLVEPMQQKASQVEHQINAIGMSIDALDSAIGGMQDRLRSVLIDIVPTPDSPSKAEPLVPLASELATVAARIEYQEVRIRSLLQRLEL